MTEVGSSIAVSEIIDASEMYAGKGSGPDPGDYARGVARQTMRSSGLSVTPVASDNPRSRGMCRNSPAEKFYPSSGSGVKVAQKICEQCVIQEECLEYALDNGEIYGVWGGASERERKRILKHRRVS